MIFRRNANSCCHGNGGCYVHFTYPSTSNITWYLYTGDWVFSYPGKVRDNMARAGFTETEVDDCYKDWKHVARVSRAGVYRGDFGYRAPKGVDVNEFPNDQTEARIVRILENTYPVAEVAVAAAIPLSFFLLLCIIVCWRGAPRGAMLY